MSLEEVQKIESNYGKGNNQFRLADATSRWTEAYNNASVELAKNIEEEIIKGKGANKSSELAKYQERRPSRVAALALIVGTFVLAAGGMSNYASPATQAISLGSDAWKKPYEAKGIASSGLEQYTRIAMEKLRETVSANAKMISEIASQVTNINSKTGGM